MAIIPEFTPYLDPKMKRLLAPSNAQPKGQNMVVVQPFLDGNGGFAKLDHFYQEIADNDYRVSVVTLPKGDDLGKAFEIGERALARPQWFDVLLGGHGWEEGIVFGPGKTGELCIQQIDPKDFKKVRRIYIMACDTFQFGRQLVQITQRPVWAPLGNPLSYGVTFYSTSSGCEMACFDQGKNLYRLISSNGTISQSKITESATVQKMKDRVLEAEQKGKKDHFALEYLSHYYFSHNEPEQADLYIQKGLKDIPACRYLAGSYAFIKGDQKIAIFHFHIIKHPEAQLMLGKILLKEKKYEKALGHLRFAAQSKFKAQPLISYAQGHLFAQEGKWKEAAASFKEAVTGFYRFSIKNEEAFVVDSLKQLERLRAFSPQSSSLVATISKSLYLKELLRVNKLFQDTRQSIAI